MNYRSLIQVALAGLAGCATEVEPPDIVATDVPPGAESTKADGDPLDFLANHCEVFVDRVITARSSHGSLRVRTYLKTLNERLDGAITEIGYFARLSTEDGGLCGDSYACPYEGQWRAWEALPFVGADDYWTLDFTIAHDFTWPLVYEGAFFVRTETGKTLWVNPEGGGNFFVDRNLAYDVEGVLGGASYTRGIGPDRAAVTADDFVYLNPGRCR